MPQCELLFVVVVVVVVVFAFIIIFFLGLPLGHMKAPSLGVELELQLPAYITATAILDPGRVCDLHPSSWQCWILNPLSGPRD